MTGVPAAPLNADLMAETIGTSFCNAVFGGKEMKCKICGGNRIDIIYQGLIRDGRLGSSTTYSVDMYHCLDCGVIWHDPVLKDINEYYESDEYQISTKVDPETEDKFYQFYDERTLEKFQITGTDIFRHKTVADLGCGAGAFLDFLKGVSDDIVAVEPSKRFRQVLAGKGFHTYAYTKDALSEWKGRVDVITSFDVVHMVEDPLGFMRDTYQLLSEGGIGIIGVLTDSPIWRKVLGTCYEKQIIFNTQFLWLFSEKSLKELAFKAGFTNVEIRCHQRYGLDNLIGWCLEKSPRHDVKDSFLQGEIDAAWRSICCAHGVSDYIVAYVRK